MEALAKEGIELGKVVATIRRLSADEREQRLAEAEDKWQWSLKATRDEGIEIGEKQQATVIAHQMKADGMNAAAISRYTGIPEDEICRLP
jgi:predicted transposase/invertase (TIGR01784 family)